MRAVSRRELVLGAAGLGLVAGCGRLPGQAQEPAKVPHIGVLAFVTADPSAADNAAFRQGLRDLGYSGDEINHRERCDGFGSPDEWLAHEKADVIFAFFGFNVPT